MFGLTRREQRWKAEQQAAEIVLGFAATVVRSAADVRIAEAEAEVERLRKENIELRKQRFDKDRAHCLIYDLFINDDKIIRSMAAQSLKRLLGIEGPAPNANSATGGVRENSNG
jgi:hypothetical protein